MKTKTLLITLALLLLVAPLTASAFDGDRKGFMLNLGAGFGQGKLSGSSDSVDGTGFGTDFKIGGGTSSQLMIYYTNRVVWYSPDGTSSTWYNSMSAAGVSYFLNPDAPSFFFSGALGIGVISIGDGFDSETGFGFTLGAGYEFARNFIAEITYMYAGLDNDLSISNIMVSVAWLAY